MAAWPLPGHAGQRRDELQALYRHLSEQIHRLDEDVTEQARTSTIGFADDAPGVGAVTALATDVILGDAVRFKDGKALVSDVGMIPSEYSSGTRQRFGSLSKQGNSLLRFLWCEAAMTAVRRDVALKRFSGRKLHQKGLGKARVAVARKLGIRLWIMLRDHIDYQEFCRRRPTPQ
jgi:transposase